MPRKQSDPRSGYALLMIFCMAAMISIMLYSQMPRVAFEAQRDKEQLLMDRGQEYSRAIKVYVRTLKKFPPTMEALENTNNLRFLRRRYKDPMTGKDEWRLIHVGPNGVFTDSLVYGKKDKDVKEKQTFITELAPIGGGPQTDTGVNLATRKRQSDGPNAPGTGDAAPVDPNAPPTPANGNGPQYNPTGIAGQANTGSALPPGVQLPAGIGAQQQQGNFLPIPGQSGSAPPAIPGISPGTNSGVTPSTPNAASDMIRNLLTTPRPGGQFGTPAAASASPASGQTIGGGIAGVASNLERQGIKIYNEKTAYNEWEFVYDMSKDTGMATQTQGTQQQQQNPQGNQPGQTAQPGQTGASGIAPIAMPRPIGQNPSQ